MKKISAVITAYREPENLFQIIDVLKKRDFEIIVVGDCLDLESIERLKKMDIRLLLSNNRRGKWRALNEALKHVDTDYILFLDSDTIPLDIPNPKGEVIEISKEVRGDNLIEKLCGVDFLFMNLSSRISSKILGFGMVNGSAFISKTDIAKKLAFNPKIIEDADFGLRAGFEGYKMSVGGKVITKAPKNLKEWFKQRERWALGGAELFTEFFVEFLKRPKFIIPFLIIYYPAFIGMFLALFLPDSIAIKFLYLLLPLLLSLPVKAVTFIMLLVFEFHLIKNLLVIALSFFIWFFFTIYSANRCDIHIDPKILPLYYFFYSPLWTMLNIAMLLRYVISRFIGKEIELEDWKV